MKTSILTLLRQAGALMLVLFLVVQNGFAGLDDEYKNRPESHPGVTVGPEGGLAQGIDFLTAQGRYTNNTLQTYTNSSPQAAAATTDEGADRIQSQTQVGDRLNQNPKSDDKVHVLAMNGPTYTTSVAGVGGSSHRSEAQTATVMGSGNAFVQGLSPDDKQALITALKKDAVKDAAKGDTNSPSLQLASTLASGTNDGKTAKVAITFTDGKITGAMAFESTPKNSQTAQIAEGASSRGAVSETGRTQIQVQSSQSGAAMSALNEVFNSNPVSTVIGQLVATVVTREGNIGGNATSVQASAANLIQAAPSAEVGQNQPALPIAREGTLSVRGNWVVVAVESVSPVSDLQGTKAFITKGDGTEKETSLNVTPSANGHTQNFIINQNQIGSYAGKTITVSYNTFSNPGGAPHPQSFQVKIPQAAETLTPTSPPIDLAGRILPENIVRR